ncbi:hypothetical protein EOD41_00065 [Mucilaginibacter limnophilus]|uniref:Uncharacterized protein n=1 Tax=Mucilaginibacter limnophilus TaxID=1932778 RepID=A0A437MXH3_9SPHI|nr:hypothetical protein [Mucilaginibacter limnophilus]RVU02371.1 hypothetical protein EOD41_00065 [Mucilaginibacter limnophilus]
MQSKIHWLALNQYLGQLEPFKSLGLPTDSFVDKEIPACGATHWELHYERNSLIVEHNLPVIIGKCNKMNGKARKNKVVLGVYENVTVEDIKYYIVNRKGYKKIITTPESFYKVIEAIGEIVFTDYFLLFDECEKAIQDVNYREDIINPIDAFFAFKGKAFISATPIIPSDPRFKDFNHVKIKPAYIHKQAITVFTTNNIVYQLKSVFDQYSSTGTDEGRKYYIFFKSTKRIRNIIKGLKLDDYAVYCSETSVKDLKRNSIEHAYDQINDKFAKYNFMTSRFFSAVDIDYKDYHCDPIIIMISDVLAVEHSVIDPATEAVQIVGRFRKPELVKGEPEIIVKKDVYHIANYNTKLTSFNETEIMAILEDKRKLHEFISTFKPISDIEYINSFIEEILKLNGFGYFLRKGDGGLNYFMVDNFKYVEQVKLYYKSAGSLIERYRAISHFNVTEQSKHVLYSLTDEQLTTISDHTAYTTVNEFVGQRVKVIMESNSAFNRAANLSLLRFSYAEQMSIIDQYGLENAAKLDYNINKIAKQMEEAKGLKRLLPIIRYIQRTFKLQGYTSDEIEGLLKKGITETGLLDLKPTVQLLRNGVILSERKRIRKDEQGNWLRGYEMLGYVHTF